MTKPLLLAGAATRFDGDGRLTRAQLRRGLVLPFGLMLLWWSAYHFHWSQSKLFVPPEQVWATAVAMGQDGTLWRSLAASLQRFLAGFVIGSIAGLTAGGMLGTSRLLDSMVGPTLHAFKQVSLLAWIPLISVWFGLGDAAKIAFLSLAAFFPVLLNTFEGIRGVPSGLVETARVFRFSRTQVLLRVVLPAALPSIYTGIYLGLLYAWLATLGAEYLLSSGLGIGNLLTDGREHFWMDQVLLGVIVVGLVGFVLNLAATSIEGRSMKWRAGAAARY